MIHQNEKLHLAEKQNNSFGRSVRLCTCILNSERYFPATPANSCYDPREKLRSRCTACGSLDYQRVTKSNEICEENLKCFSIVYLMVFRYFLFQTVLTSFWIRSTLLSISKELKKCEMPLF